jgi:hypothetical protein
MPAPSPRGHLSNRKTPPPFRSRPRGMKDGQITQVLGKLDEALPPLEVSIPSTIAAFLRLHPEMSDSDVMRRIRGLDDVAEVQRIRGLLAAGRDPDRPPDRRDEPESVSATRPVAAEPPVQVRASSAHPGVAVAMPTFAVTAPDGSVIARGLRYRPAMVAKVSAGAGATLSVEQ